MSDRLDLWLPKDALEFTRVHDPVRIDENAILDLGRYHPLDSVEKPFNFRLVRIENEARATVEVKGDSWDERFAAVLKLLKLRLVNEGRADEHLLDDAVPGELVPMSGWKVVSWTIKRTGFDGHEDPPEVTDLTDRIVWQRMDATGEKAVSSYTWKPYTR